MTVSRPLTFPARIAIAALAVLGLVGGWMVVLGGGFHHGQMHSRETTFVDGPAAFLMAAIQFLMAAIAVAALLRAAGVRRPWVLLACGAVLLPPLVFRMS